MKKLRLSLLAALVVSLVLVSCKKDEEDNFNYGFRNQIKPLLTELKKDKNFSLFVWNMERISANAIKNMEGATVFAMPNEVLTKSNGNRDSLTYAQIARHMVKGKYTESELKAATSLGTISDGTLGVYMYGGELYVNNVVVKEVRDAGDYTICLVGSKFSNLEGKVVDRITSIGYVASSGSPAKRWEMIYREDGALNEVIRYDNQGSAGERHWFVLNSAGLAREYKYVPAGSQPSDVAATVDLTYTSNLVTRIAYKGQNKYYDFVRDSEGRISAWNEYVDGSKTRQYNYAYDTEGNVATFGEEGGGSQTPLFTYDATKNILNALPEELNLMLMTVLTESGFPLVHSEFYSAANNLTEGTFNDAQSRTSYIKGDYRADGGAGYPTWFVTARDQGSSPAVDSYPVGYYPVYRKYVR